MEIFGARVNRSNVGDAMKFPNETDKDYNTNTDIYNYVYGIQILEVPKRSKAMKV